MSDRNKSIAYGMLLILLCGALYFPYLGSTPFFNKGEPREALAVQDIVQRGEWLVPLKRATDIPSKPPLFHWSAALMATLTGKLDEPTIRFPSAFYAMVGVLIVYFFSQKLFKRQVAFLSAAILATTWVYADQAVTARVDMTLCFVVTLNLVLFYSLYRAFLTHPLWFYIFYVLLGTAILAKGPLGIVLPGLVIATFVMVKKRWDLIPKFCLHPGVLLTIVLGVGWYVAAVTREGEGFFNRQILQENLSRFVGGSGHNHPSYYYLSYLFILAMPWGLFLPFVLWDAFKQRFRSADEILFLKLWFASMFLFFSISIGKRAVYLLPLYPALSMLTAVWFCHQGTTSDGRNLRYRCIAIVAGITGLLLLMITLLAAWNHTGWLFAVIETLLKPKDHADLLTIRNEIGALGASFWIVSLVSSALWLWLAKDLWVTRMYHAALLLVWLSILLAFVNRAIFLPVIAEAKSYRPFMEEVNQYVKPGDKLYLHREVYNSDPLIFYRGGGLVEKVEQPADKIVPKIGHGSGYLVLEERDWITIQQLDHNIPPPLLKSTGAGPEGDAPIVLVRFEGL